MYVLLDISACTNSLKIFQRGTLLAYDDRQILAVRYAISDDYDCTTMSQSGVYFTISPRAGWLASRFTTTFYPILLKVSLAKKRNLLLI